MSAETRGTPSPAERVAAVEQAEDEAARRLADAQRSAETVVAAAHDQGEVEVARVVEQAEDEARAHIAGVAETAERQAAEVLAAAEKERRCVAEQAGARSHAATDLILGWLGH